MPTRQHRKPNLANESGSRGLAAPSSHTTVHTCRIRRFRDLYSAHGLGIVSPVQQRSLQRLSIGSKPVGQFVKGHPVHARFALYWRVPAGTHEVGLIGSHICSIKSVAKARGGADAVNVCCDPCGGVRVPPVSSPPWWLVPFGCSAFIESVRLLVASKIRPLAKPRESDLRYYGLC
jgi:hypothetical protein